MWQSPGRLLHLIILSASRIPPGPFALRCPGDGDAGYGHGCYEFRRALVKRPDVFAEPPFLGSFLVSLVVPWDSLGVPWDAFGGPLGVLWGTLGVPRGPLGVPWGALWVPWAPMGRLWGVLWGPLGPA